MRTLYVLFVLVLAGFFTYQFYGYLSDPNTITSIESFLGISISDTVFAHGRNLGAVSGFVFLIFVLERIEKLVCPAWLFIKEGTADRWVSMTSSIAMVSISFTLGWAALNSITDDKPSNFYVFNYTDHQLVRDIVYLPPKTGPNTPVDEQGLPEVETMEFPVLFEEGRSSFSGNAVPAHLRMLGLALRDCLEGVDDGKVRIVVSGHASSSGSAEDNAMLIKARAEAAYDALTVSAPEIAQFVQRLEPGEPHQHFKDTDGGGEQGDEYDELRGALNRRADITVSVANLGECSLVQGLENHTLASR